jgi:hypothetical protein
MKDLIKDLEKVCSKIEEMKEIAQKSYNGDYFRAEVDKKIEDGILNSIHTANQHQLNFMISSYKFRFYTELNNKDLLKAEITKRIRDNRLKEIGI